MRSVLPLIALLFVFSSCEKDEIPVDYVPPISPPSGDSIRTNFQQINMGADYANRVYYDLETDSVVGQHLRSDWDLAFSCGTNDNKVRMNDSRLMAAYKIDEADIDNVSSRADAVARYDESDGTTTAMDGWMDAEAVYVLYRGIDENEIDLGFYKVQIMGVTADAYTLRYAPLSSTTHTEVVIPKDAERSFIHFSFTAGVQAIEPHKDDWDLLFTQYTYFFSGEENPFGNFELHYIVAGVLLNPNQVEAQGLTQFDFENIDSDDLDTVALTEEEDVIGYDWKVYDIDAQLYTVLDNAYLINSVEGNHFKLQFTSFIDAEGQRGAPAFVSRLLE